MRRLIAIDPGASGGIAWVDTDEAVAHVMSMPEGMTEQADVIRGLRCSGCESISAVVEAVGGYMPGNSGPAAASFARHCGNIEAILYCLGIPTEMVSPKVWQGALGSLPKAGKGATGKEKDEAKRERKRAIKEWAARSFPYLPVTLKTADALGILNWAWKNRNGG
jgi:hypothetical protein